MLQTKHFLIGYTGTKAEIEAVSPVATGSHATATDTGEAGFYNGSAWVWTLPSDDVTMPKVGTPTLDTLTEDFTTRGSSGVSDGTLTYVAVGSTAVKISVAAGEGYIRTSNDQQAPLVFCKWATSTDLYTFSAPAAGQENVIFIGIEYNAGTPQAVAKAAFTDWNWYDNFPLARASYDGTTMRILNAYAHAEDTANLTRKWMRLNFPFHREEAPEGSGGLELSVSLRALAMTAGKIWHGYNNYSLGVLASGVAFDTHYKRAGGGFNSTIGATSYPNTQYDNGSGTLQDLGNSKYGTLWVYVDVSDGSLDVMYGAVNANSVAIAQADTAPTVPAHLQYHGRLIGRIIFQKSATSATLVESAWTNMFAASQVGDHALLSNLLGTSPYYHLPTPTAPAANLMNVAGIVNGETDWSNKPIFDATAPADLAGTAAAGTSLLASHRDHVHLGLASADVAEAVAFLNGGTGTHTAMDSHIASTALHATEPATSFTPVIIGTTTTGTGTYTTQTGHYSVVGDMVFFVINFVWTAHTGTGNMQIDGLPYTVSSTEGNYPIVVNWNNLTLLAVGNKILAQAAASTTKISINEIGSGANSPLPIDTAGIFRASGWYYK
jgi:hypothetical protein